jgi:predicted nucleic acid-binding protein
MELDDAQAEHLTSEIKERFYLCFWNALVVASASQASADRILREDLNNDQFIEGIRIENPLL